MADDTVRSENKALKRLVSDNDIPSLIRLLHGSSYSKLTIVKEFQLYLERNRTEENKYGSFTFCIFTLVNYAQLQYSCFGINLGPSKAQILAKIAEIASWSKCSEAGMMNGRTCWLVQSDVLDRYNLTELSAINTWEFATETKKRGRKADDSRTDEDTPPAKTPRVSLIKKFVQPTSLSTNRVPSSQENKLPESGTNINGPAQETIFTTPKAKKRISLISLPSSATKKPKSDTKSTPLTNFLKKMSAKEALSKSTENVDDALEVDGIECFTVD
jgi:hypothetical protein